MADEKDTNLRAEQRVYMLGDDLMIIPRWAKNPVIPTGDWDIIQFEEKDDLYQAFVALRPGAIVPLTEIAQSTSELDMNTLTLLVNPDENGNATGILYQDSGDGFEYKTGYYAIYELKANTEDGIVKVSINQTEGKLQNPQKKIRIGIVSDGKTTFSEYKEGLEISMKNVKDKEKTINTAKLKWSTIDPAKEPSTQEKLKIQTEKMKKTGQAMEW